MKNYNQYQETPKIYKTVFGKFDGQNCVDDNGRVHAVPENYASKSKLVEGDSLKLTILTDGTQTYKKIDLAQRINFLGIVINDKGDQIMVKDGNDNYYFVLEATIRYFQLREGMKVSAATVLDGKWAAVEGVIDED